MIKKKIVLQKGFRIDNRIIKKIDELSNVTGRSQNELAEKAFQMLFADNVPYFIESDVINELGDAEHAELGFGGLYFIKEKSVLLIFSQNPNAYKDEVNAEYLKCCLPCIETEEFRNYIFDKIEIAKGYNSMLINFIITNDSEEFQLQLHKTMMHIDLDFPQMQEWIKTEFDFS